MGRIEAKAKKDHFHRGLRREGERYTCSPRELALLTRLGWAAPAEPEDDPEGDFELRPPEAGAPAGSPAKAKAAGKPQENAG